MDNAHPMDNLAKLANELRRDVARAGRARERLHTAILEALASGTSQADITRATGYSRERIRQLTKRIRQLTKEKA